MSDHRVVTNTTIRFRCQKHDTDLKVNEEIGPLVQEDTEVEWTFDLSGMYCPDPIDEEDPCDEYWEATIETDY